MNPATAFTDEERAEIKAKFLVELARHASAIKAIDLVDASRKTLYQWRKADKEFDADWHEAKEEGLDRLEDELDRRGFRGMKIPKTVAGKRVDVTQYDTTAAIFRMKAERREKYSDRHLLQTSGNMHLSGGVEINGNRDAIRKFFDAKGDLVPADSGPEKPDS